MFFIDKFSEDQREMMQKTMDKHGVKILVDEDESEWKEIGDPVLHIETRKWAEMFLIAPLGANSLAKMASGQCDNLLTNIFRAWNFKRNPVIVAPAMNTEMYHVINISISEEYFHQ